MSSAAWASGHQGPLTVTDDFAVLDDPLEQAAFTAVVEGEGARRESVLVVQGMFCAACADAVESALDGVPGVDAAQVNAASRRLRVRWNPAHTTLSALARRVGDRGYRLLPLQQALSLDERWRESRLALWRLFVAGFCMMQVMMFAWPAYVAGPGDIPPDIMQLLRIGQLVLTLPVLLFSAAPIFRAAWSQVRAGAGSVIGMDLPIVLGLAAAFAASAWATLKLTVALTLTLTLAFTAVLATLVASLLPLGLNRLGADPALASGPVATVVQDILSVAVYLGLAAWIL